MSWPNSVPPNLRRNIEAALSMRDSDATDVWAVLRDWLIKHSIQAPDLPVDPPKDTKWDKMDNDGG